MRGQVRHRVEETYRGGLESGVGSRELGLSLARVRYRRQLQVQRDAARVKSTASSVQVN